MKYIKNIIFILSVLLVSSCSFTDLDLLDDPNRVTPDNAQTDLFFNAIALDFANMHSSANGISARVMRQLAMTGGKQYNNAFASTSYNGIWNSAYAGLLPDLNQLISITEAEGSKNPHFAGASKVLKAYTIMLLVDFFGDVPYSEAGQGVAVLSPKADSQVEIYNTALELLNAGITDLGDPDANMSADLFNSGNAANWIKFANSLKIKWYLNVGSGDGSFGSEIQALASLAIRDASEDFTFAYGIERSEPNSRHPWYNNGYEVNPTIYQSNYFMWSLKEEKGFEDPRLDYYFYRQDLTFVDEIDAFTLDCGGTNAPLHYPSFMPYCHVGEGYWGRDHGNDDGIPPDTDRRTVAGVYPAGGKFDNGESTSSQNSGADGSLGAGIAPIMLSSYTSFMLAEAALTRSTGGDAAAMLEEGIRGSISKVLDMGAMQADTFAPKVEDVEAYVAYVMDAFNSAASDDDKLNIIMKEYHIALWGNGIEAYNGYRRTTYPSGLQATLQENFGDFPRLMYYPADYLNLNKNISNQRSLTEQVFWDKNAPGAIN